MMPQGGLGMGPRAIMIIICRSRGMSQLIYLWAALAAVAGPLAIDWTSLASYFMNSNPPSIQGMLCHQVSFFKMQSGLVYMLFWICTSELDLELLNYALGHFYL